MITLAALAAAACDTGAQMIDNLTADENDIVATAQAFAQDVVRPNTLSWEKEGRIPNSALKSAASKQLTRIQVPTAFEGLGHRYFVKMRVCEELAKASMAFSFSLVNLQNVAAKLANDTPAALANEFVSDLMACERFGATALTEPGAGSDFSSIQTLARKTDSGWSLSGEKGWITNAAFADMFILYAQTDPDAGWRGIACFLIDAQREGFSRVDAYRLYGANAIGTGGFRLNNYHAPPEHMLHPPGDAFKRALGSINGARTYVAAMCCGMVDDALAQAIAYGRARTAFGKPLIENQGLRWALADIATDLEAARLLTYRAAHLIDEDSPDAILAASHAKKFAARMAQRALPECIQAMGANGLLEEHRLGQQLACAKVAHYVDGSTEIQNERIAALVLDS